MTTLIPTRSLLGDCRIGGYAMLFAAVTLVGTSCSRSDRIEVYPTQGVVRFEGQPAAGALVVFHPENPSPEMQKIRPAGNVESDGTYHLSTYGPRDGAPAGEYRVTVIWAGPGDGERPGPDRMGGRYANPAAALLKAAVREGDNRIEPFELRRR